MLALVRIVEFLINFLLSIGLVLGMQIVFQYKDEKYCYLLIET